MSSWPKRMRPSDYVDYHYAPGSMSAKSIINRIKTKKLPGEQDEAGHWFVLVNEDFSPALDGATPISKPAQSAVERILSNQH